jgi:2-polyprenyl-3-methyl-5-hydroxy-6-metoxy-1,4-benzoquinol methylase
VKEVNAGIESEMLTRNHGGSAGEASGHSTAPDCPICGGRSTHFVTKRAQGTDWAVRRCSRCGHGFVHNRPSTEYLRLYYSSNRNSHAHTGASPTPAEASVGWIPAVDLLRRVGAPRSGFALDVGAGYGGLAYAFSQAGYAPVLLDLSPEVRDLAASIPNAASACCSFEEFEWADPLSIITMSQVLEHAIDPIGWLSHARRLIHADGVLMVAVPNFSGIYRLLGHKDPFICPPEHLNFFTVTSLTQALGRTGFTVCRMQTDSRVVLAHHSKRFSALRKAVGQMWNLGSGVLDRTPFGIIATVFAKPSPVDRPR